jgi:hypothetical protein
MLFAQAYRFAEPEALEFVRGRFGGHAASRWPGRL